MKKEIVCPVCGGRGHVSWINSTETSFYSGSKTCPHCNGTRWVDVDMTNADHIRSMTDEELRHFICGVTDCTECLFWNRDDGCSLEGWLKQPYKED